MADPDNEEDNKEDNKDNKEEGVRWTDLDTTVQLCNCALSVSIYVSVSITHFDWWQTLQSTVTISCGQGRVGSIFFNVD